ncbi:MAG TPA: GNAT family N-acetyltransferase [Anaerolineae bacterium]|nr:GNAT family N-acetyltransferase [Anaerolineae bacterium]HQI87348.1 GNAT family N-acetyltransferase [Anaerolineae bacterium]
MMAIIPYLAERLTALQTLVNAHLEMAIPGWALPAEFIAERLTRYPEQRILDPWVIERQTMLSVEAEQVLAAVHLLRYSDGDRVAPDYRNAGDIAWLLFAPGAEAAGREVLAAARQLMRQWDVRVIYAWDTGLPVPLCSGISDVWPHIRHLFAGAGFSADGGVEYIFGGGLEAMPAPVAAPMDGVCVQSAVSGTETTFILRHNAEHIGRCECVADLTQDGQLPAFAGWGKLEALEVAAPWRTRGLGRWLVQHAVAWLREMGCARVVFSVTPDDDARGAGRFYRRLGWERQLTLEKGWVDRGIAPIR